MASDPPSGGRPPFFRGEGRQEGRPNPLRRPGIPRPPILPHDLPQRPPSDSGPVVPPPEGKRGPILPATHFQVELGEGVTVGIASITPLVDGGAPKPGTTSDPASTPLHTVTLTRAVDGNRALWSWHRAVAEGKKDLRSVRIVLLGGPGGAPVYGWILHGARPLRWIGPGFHAHESLLATEALEITYDRIDWDDIRPG